jgi:hypothetical protein
MRLRLVRIAVVLLGARLIWMYVVPAWNQISTDFPNYYTAAWAVRHETSLADLYDPVWFQHETVHAGITGQAALFDSFPPFSALVMWPLAKFSPLTAKRIWVVVNVLALAGIVLMVAGALGAPFSSVLLVALLAGDALGNNFLFGQFYIVLTLLIVAAFVYATRVPALAGWCLALAVVVKIFPILLLGYFVLARAWKAVAWTLIGIAVLSLAGVAVMGWTPHRTYIEEAFPRSLRGEIQDPYNVQSNSLQALLRRALVYEPGLNPRPIADAPGVYLFLRPLLILMIVLSALAACWSSQRKAGLEWGILVGALLLTMPAQASYQQFLLFPGIAAMVHTDIDRRFRVAAGVAFALICSNYMGAMSGMNEGLSMLIAFPRVFLVLALWISFLYIAGARLRVVPILAAATVAAAISAFVELERWQSDTADRASMVSAEAAGFIETHPEVTAMGLTYLTMREPGFVRRFPDGSELKVDDIPPVERSSTADGNFVAFSERVDGRYRISEWSRATGQTRTLLQGPADYRYPAYDLSGGSLAFATDAAGNWDIGRWSRSDGHQTILTTSSANDLTPFFSPDGRTIYFSSDRRRGYRFTAIFAIAF